jgi:hypothetical protein
MRVDLSGFELINMVRPDKPGILRNRKAMVSQKTPTASTTFVAGFSIESASTSEVWHYLFEQHSTSLEVTLRVFTEEWVEMFNLPMGVLPKNPVISWGQNTGQLMVHSPAFSSALWGIPGGGLISAVKQDSINPDTTAIDIPRGHISSFGDRFAIAQGNVIYFNDPPGAANSYEVRTFVGLSNAIALPGAVFDLIQGPDGALYIFTSAGVFTLPADATGQGQSVAGWLQKIPGIETVQSGNACAIASGVAVLQRDHVVLLPTGRVIPITNRSTRYIYSGVVRVDDLRIGGRLLQTDSGFAVSFPGFREFMFHVDLNGPEPFVSAWTTNGTLVIEPVATLQGRDGETLYVMPNQVARPFVRYTANTSVDDVIGVASGAVQMPADAGPVIRRMFAVADNLNGIIAGLVDDGYNNTTVPAKTTDAIIGTGLWGTANVFQRKQKNVRMNFNVRASQPQVQVLVQGSHRTIGASIELEAAGQGQRGRTTATT